MLWEPGTATGYHALTFGYILGEVVRRVTGRRIAVDGIRLVNADRLATMTTITTTAPDRVLGVPVAKCLGYFSRLPEFGDHRGAFGCKGSGGSVAFADPDQEAAIAFTHNRMAAPPQDLAASITDHVRNVLTATR